MTQQLEFNITFLTGGAYLVGILAALNQMGARDIDIHQVVAGAPRPGGCPPPVQRALRAANGKFPIGSRYVNGRRNKGISAPHFLLARLAEHPRGTLYSALEHEFVGGGFAASSVSPALSQLVSEGLARRTKQSDGRRANATDKGSREAQKLGFKVAKRLGGKKK